MDWPAFWAFFRRSRRLLRNRRQAEQRRTAASPEDLAALRERERRDELDRFLATLNRLIASNPRLRSRLYVISLSDFRDAVAEKWIKLADKVAMVTRTIITRHIDNSSLVVQTDDETFVLALPRLSREEARARMAVIANDLSSHLIGDRLVAGQRPLAVAANLPLQRALTSDGRLNVQAIRGTAEFRAVGHRDPIRGNPTGPAAQRIGAVDGGR